MSCIRTLSDGLLPSGLSMAEFGMAKLPVTNQAHYPRCNEDFYNSCNSKSRKNPRQVKLKAVG